jgi:hypothetical protein
VKVLSADDRTWKFTLEPPPEGWTSPSFDDRDWPALTRAALKEPGWQDTGTYQYRVCAGQGAVCLGIPGDLGPEGRPSWWQRLLGRRSASPAGRLEKSLWVRRVFDINPPQSVLQAP